MPFIRFIAVLHMQRTTNSIGAVMLISNFVPSTTSLSHAMLEDALKL